MKEIPSPVSLEEILEAAKAKLDHAYKHADSAGFKKACDEFKATMESIKTFAKT